MLFLASEPHRMLAISLPRLARPVVCGNLRRPAGHLVPIRVRIATLDGPSCTAPDVPAIKVLISKSRRRVSQHRLRQVDRVTPHWDRRLNATSDRTSRISSVFFHRLNYNARVSDFELLSYPDDTSLASQRVRHRYPV